MPVGLSRAASLHAHHTHASRVNAESVSLRADRGERRSPLFCCSAQTSRSNWAVGVVGRRTRVADALPRPPPHREQFWEAAPSGGSANLTGAVRSRH